MAQTGEVAPADVRAARPCAWLWRLGGYGTIPSAAILGGTAFSPFPAPDPQMSTIRRARLTGHICPYPGGSLVVLVVLLLFLIVSNVLVHRLTAQAYQRAFAREQLLVQIETEYLIDALLAHIEVVRRDRRANQAPPK